MEKKRGRGGAPEKPDSEKRIRRLELRLTKDEYQQLNQKKSTTKIKDLGTFIRFTCLEKPLPMKPQLSSQEEKVLSLLFEMQQDIRRVGVNVNQSTKRINATTDYQDLQREVGNMSANVTSLAERVESILNTVSPTLLRDGGAD